MRERPEDLLLKKQAAFVKQSFAGILQKFSAGKIVPPAMPQVVFELRNVIKRQESTVKDVSEILEKDPVISLRLISVAKSPVYKGLGDVKSVFRRRSPGWVSRKETLNIVVAISNKSLYEAKQPQFRVALDKMWGHSLACAYASKLIAQSLFLDDPETIFLMGLTHDVGKVILLRAFADPQKSLDFATVMTAIQEGHRTVGNMLLKRWGFGDEFSRVVALHEGANFSPQTNQEILVVHLANILTRKMGLSSFEWDGKDLAEVSSAQLLGL